MFRTRDMTFRMTSDLILLACGVLVARSSVHADYTYEGKRRPTRMDETEVLTDKIELNYLHFSHGV